MVTKKLKNKQTNKQKNVIYEKMKPLILNINTESYEVIEDNLLKKF